MNTPAIILTAATFRARFTGIADALSSLAVDYVKSLEVRPELRAELIADGFPAQTADRMERLGRGQIHPSLVLSATRWAGKLIALPLSLQTDLIANGVEVLEPCGTDSRRLALDVLSSRQIKQVFGKGVVRSLAEQRTWQAEQQPRKTEVAPATFERDGIHLAAPGVVTKEQMLQWLARNR